MYKLLQVDSCLGVGSTGRITESIAKLAQSHGWDCYIIHGARYVKKPSCMKDIQSVSVLGECLHYAEGLLADNHGLASRFATRRVVEQIKTIKPDIIHLHCIHGYYLNFKILFEYLNKTDIPVVWTFHDCWAFTGHCAHFIEVGCDKWKKECYNCTISKSYPRSFFDFSRRNYKLKKSLFLANRNLHLVPVSEWLSNLTRQSFFQGKDVRVIRNGIDLSVFRPIRIDDKKKFRVLGVSGVWTKSKGLEDFYKLRELLGIETFEIVLVGLNREQINTLPKGIIGIGHTRSAEELAFIYSSADVFVNLTYADTFPTVNIESLACGTPVVTYQTGGSPEAVTSSTGWVIKQGDIEGVAFTITELSQKSIEARNAQRKNCRELAEREFDKDKQYQQYMDFYNNLIINNF